MKMLVIIFVILLVSVGLYDVYLYLKIPNIPTLSETPRVVDSQIDDGKLPLITSTTDITSLDAVDSNSPIVIRGRYQSIDAIENIINSRQHSYVFGILDDEGKLVKVWITEEEYQEVSSVIPVGNTSQYKPVVVEIRPNQVTVKNAF